MKFQDLGWMEGESSYAELENYRKIWDLAWEFREFQELGCMGTERGKLKDLGTQGINWRNSRIWELSELEEFMDLGPQGIGMDGNGGQWRELKDLGTQGIGMDGNSGEFLSPDSRNAEEFRDLGWP